MTKFDLEDLTPMTAEEMAFGELEDCLLTLDVVGKQIEAGLRDAALSTLGVAINHLTRGIEGLITK